MSTILELRRVSLRVLRDVSLQIPRGAFFSLLGPSGCGKTTTLRVVAGFEQPAGGEVHLNGARIDHLKPYQRNVNTVFQSYALFPHLSVRGNIEFGLRRRGDASIDARVRDVIELFELAGKESRFPAELSGGERQRVALARSLVLSPDVLLLDEPLSALDPRLRLQVRSELKTLQRRVGVTFLFVTHDQEEALSLSDQMAVMNEGAIEQVGTPEDLYLRPRTVFVASFLGRMNWLDGVGVRPEATRLARQAPAGTRSFPATVTQATFLGNCIHVETRLATGEPFTAELPRDAAQFAPGETVYVWWHPHDELHLAPHSASPGGHSRP